MAELQRYLKEKMQQLYPLEQSSEMVDHFLRKQFIRLFSCLLLGILFGFAILLNNWKQEMDNENKIMRPSYGEADKQVTLQVKPEGSAMQKESITFDIAPKEYSYEEFKKEVEKGKQYVNQVFLQDNKSAEEVRSNLFFPDKVENSFLDLQWSTDKEEILSSTGEIDNVDLQSKELIVITVTFRYKDYEAIYLMSVYVCPPNLSKKELFFKHLKKQIQMAEERRTEKEVSLPKEIDGKKLFYSEATFDSKILILIPFLIGLFVFEGAKEELKRAQKKREQQLRIDYPEIMNQIAVLLSAGMTIRSAFGRITEQYVEKKGSRKRKYGYEEIAVTYYEMQNGLTEVEALERMGMRIQIMSYRKLMTLLSQNARKGSRDLINVLELEAYSAYEERKEMVKALGEEAGTKLLFPMLIMLMIVLTIVTVPIFMTF